MNPVRVYLGIGSNIDPAENVETALDLLGQSCGPLQKSAFYQTASVGFEGPDFINLVVSFATTDDFVSLSGTLKAIEQVCGRNRSMETCKGSRTLDLDILMFGDYSGEVAGYWLPRREIFQRQFVWQPLLELLEQSSDLTGFENAIRQKLLILAGQHPPLPKFEPESG